MENFTNRQCLSMFSMTSNHISKSTHHEILPFEDGINLANSKQLYQMLFSSELDKVSFRFEAAAMDLSLLSKYLLVELNHITGLECLILVEFYIHWQRKYALRATCQISRQYFQAWQAESGVISLYHWVEFVSESRKESRSILH